MGKDDQTEETEESTSDVDSLTALSLAKAAKTEAPAPKPASKPASKPAGPKSVTLEFTMTDVEWGALRQRVGASGMPAIDRAMREIQAAIS